MLLPFATCGDKRFKSGNRELFRLYVSNAKYTKFLIHFNKSGNGKAVAAKIVINVATELCLKASL
jgi:hypothetical protein